MTIDEALSTRWQNSGKTIETLLREETLTFSILRVAANRGEPGKEKTAAQVIWTNYETVHARLHPTTMTIMGLPNASMSLEEARKEAFPYREIKGQPMGRLLDEGRIALNDLGYCLEKAYTAKTKEAARVLLFNALQSPVKETVDRGSPVVVSEGESYSREKIDEFMMGLGIIGGMGSGLLFAALIPVHIRTTWYLLLIGFIVGIAGLILFGFMHFKSIRANYKGLDEEQRVLSHLMAELDSNWSIHTNVKPKGFKGGDIDIVLIGPAGIYALEVKHWDTNVRITGDTILTDSGYKTGDKRSPMKQVSQAAMFLKKALAAKGLPKQYVNAVVVMNAKSLEFNEPSVQVWDAQALPDELSWIKDTTSKYPFDPEKAREALKALKG
jgi:Nuclease-related domain